MLHLQLFFVTLWKYEKHNSIKILTAILIDNTLFSLFGLELTQRTVLGILFNVSFPGSHPHSAGHTAGWPADPFWHHACEWHCAPEQKNKNKICYSQQLHWHHFGTLSQVPLLQLVPFPLCRTCPVLQISLTCNTFLISHTSCWSGISAAI